MAGSRALARWQRFVRRNRGRLAGSLIGWLIGRAYVHPWVRRPIAAVWPRRSPRRWVFLVGCYNSGTTILRDLLGAHPDIATLPREGVRLTDQFPNLQAGGWIRMLSQNRDKWDMPRIGMPERVRRIKRDWAPLWAPRASVFLEKSITHSVRMRWLEEAFDSPCFITIVRNGYCVCEGIHRRAAPQGGAARKIGDSYSMGLLGEQWVAINDRIEADSRKVRHVHAVTYEELTRNPLTVLGELFDHIGVERPEMTQEGDTLWIARKPFEIRNMNQQSLERLTSDQIAEASRFMGDKLHQYGYPVLDWANDEG